MKDAKNERKSIWEVRRGREREGGENLKDAQREGEFESGKNTWTRVSDKYEKKKKKKETKMLQDG